MSCPMTKPTKWLAPSKDSVQPGHPLLAIAIRTQAVFMWTAKTQIRRGGCPGWWSIRWAHRPDCWFCCAAAMCVINGINESDWFLTFEKFLLIWHVKCTQISSSGSAQQGQSWHLASVRVERAVHFLCILMHQSFVSPNGIGDIEWAGQLF